MFIYQKYCPIIFVVESLSGFSIRVIQTLQKNGFSLFILWNNFKSISVLLLKVLQNSYLNSTLLWLFLVEKLLIAVSISLDIMGLKFQFILIYIHHFFWIFQFYEIKILEKNCSQDSMNFISVCCNYYYQFGSSPSFG